MIALGRSLSRVRHLVNPVLGLAIVVGVGPLPVRRVDAQQPVVFVHGLTGTGNSWITLPNYVNTNFNSTVLTPTLGWSATYETQSANLTGALAGYLSALAISHSNGSIVTRRYLVDNGALGSRIDRHLSIGGLHRGARLAEKVRSGKFLTWLGELLTFIYDPFQYYFLADPAFAASPVATDWDVDVSGFLATFIDPGPSGNLSLDKALATAGFDALVPVLGQMEPNSLTFIDINSGPSRSAEAGATTSAGRVSIATRTNPDLLPWSLFTVNPQDFRRATRLFSYFGLVMYVYYSAHPDPDLRANAWRWLQMYWALELIPISWAEQTGALLAFVWAPQALFWAAQLDRSDGLLPWSTQDYVGGTRLIGLPFDDVNHFGQTGNLQVIERVDFTLAGDFFVPRSQPPPPPPPGGFVSVSISGPAEVTEGESNTWTATANGGTGGYAYVWYRSDQGAPMTYVGSNPTYAASFVECGMTSTLRVVVEAGSGSTAASEFLITVACELEL